MFSLITLKNTQNIISLNLQQGRAHGDFDLSSKISVTMDRETLSNEPYKGEQWRTVGQWRYYDKILTLTLTLILILILILIHNSN